MIQPEGLKSELRDATCSRFSSPGSGMILPSCSSPVRLLLCQVTSAGDATVHGLLHGGGVGLRVLHGSQVLLELLSFLGVPFVFLERLPGRLQVRFVTLYRLLGGSQGLSCQFVEFP